MLTPCLLRPIVRLKNVVFANSDYLSWITGVGIKPEINRYGLRLVVYFDKKYFVSYGTDSTWDGIDKEKLKEPNSVKLGENIMNQFGKFSTTYNAMYKTLGVINKDRNK